MSNENFASLKFEIVTGAVRDFDQRYKLLCNKLRNYNATVIPNYKVIEKLFLSTSHDGELVAGLYGYHSLGRFCIDLLWVEDNFRKKGLGTKLLKEVEQYAVERKLLYIRANTATFQALDFYLKNGYEILTKLPLQTDHDKQQYDYYLVKYI